MNSAVSRSDNSEAVDSLIRFLEFMADCIKQPVSLYSFVLEHGERFSGRSLPKGYFPGAPGNCFEDAAKLVMRNERLIYCEGYAVSDKSAFPVHHAWVLDHAGEVVDVTWASVCSSEVMDSSSYFGIPFRTEFLFSQLVKNEVYGLIDVYQNHFALIRGKLGGPENWRVDYSDEQQTKTRTEYY